MAERYRGPATLRTDTLVIEVNVSLHTEHDEYVSSWGGSARGNSLDLMRPFGGKLTLLDGREGDVHIAARELDSAASGVLLHLHGSGPAPY